MCQYKFDKLHDGYKAKELEQTKIRKGHKINPYPKKLLRLLSKKKSSLSPLRSEVKLPLTMNLKRQPNLDRQRKSMIDIVDDSSAGENPLNFDLPNEAEFVELKPSSFVPMITDNSQSPFIPTQKKQQQILNNQRLSHQSSKSNSN